MTSNMLLLPCDVQLTIEHGFTLSLFIHFLPCYTFLILLGGREGGHTDMTHTAMLYDAQAVLLTTGPCSPWAPRVVQPYPRVPAVGSLHEAPARALLNLQSSGNWWPCTERRPSLPETWRPGWVCNFGCSLLQHRILFYLKSERNNERVIPSYYFCSCCLKKNQVLKPIYQLYLTSFFHLVVTVFSIWDVG